ncbi:hypothetical protein MEN41_20385, partial [Dolichospermum sp. ST_con]|nr:hypothetical protein [Dolichospermum sp. ST_con]
MNHVSLKGPEGYRHEGHEGRRKKEEDRYFYTGTGVKKNLYQKLLKTVILSGVATLRYQRRYKHQS